MIELIDSDERGDRTTFDYKGVGVMTIHGFGPWMESAPLVGGITPRYLVPARSPAPPPHAGKMKINIVSALHLLADTESHHTPNDKLRGGGVERAENEQGVNLSWCREARTEHGALIILRRRFLSDEITVGFHEDGQITVAKLEIGEQASHDEYEESEFRQRQASDAIDRLLSELG